MESVSQEKSSLNQKHLLIDHNIIDLKFHSDYHTHNENKLDESEKKFLDFISVKEKFKIKQYDDDYKKMYEFLSSKLEAMEKMDLDDECLEGKIETKRIKINKNILHEHSKNKKGRNYTKNDKDKKNHLRKNSKKKSNIKYMIINHDGEIEKFKTENIDFVDVINLDVNKEVKEKELNKFFSSKTILVSIINEMKDK